MKTERLLQYLDEYLGVSGFPDFPTALNGLQVEGRPDLEHLAVSVDVSEATIEGAVDAGAGMLLVHHGLFWGGLAPLTGRLFRKAAALIHNGVGLYSVHLPLDAHPEVGNAAVLARRLGVDVESPFGRFEDVTIGWSGALHESRDGLKNRLQELLGSEIRVISGGGESIRRVAVVTGSGGSFIGEAVEAEVDALVTGEGKHHDFVEATELGLNVFYGGHYATETWGVRALARHLEERHSLSWTFVDVPSGL